MIKINADETPVFQETPVFDGMGEVPTIDPVPYPGALSDEDLVAEFFADRLNDGWPTSEDFTLPAYEPLSYEADPEHVEEQDGDYGKDQEVFAITPSSIQGRWEDTEATDIVRPGGPEDTARWTPVFEDGDA